MTKNLPLTPEIVATYQELYYEHYKSLVVKHKSDTSQNFRNEFKKCLEKVNWTYHNFMEYKSIDMMQRLVFDHSHDLVLAGVRTKPMTCREEYRSYDPNYGALRLKCPKRTQDPDKYNA